MQTFEDFARHRISGGDRIQCLRFGPLTNNEMAAVAPSRTFYAREFFTLVNRLGSGSAGQRCGRAQTHYQG
jgi:hypothetical protein